MDKVLYSRYGMVNSFLRVLLAGRRLPVVSNTSPNLVVQRCKKFNLISLTGDSSREGFGACPSDLLD